MSADGHGLRPGVSAGDSKELRAIDHAVVWAFGVAKDLKPGTISRSWVAKFIKRSEKYVQRNWKKNPYDSLHGDDEKDQAALSQESKEIIREMLTRPRKISAHSIVEELQRKRKKPRSYGTVYRFLKEEKASAFHIISKPRISETSVENRLSFCDLLRDWTDDDFMFLAPSDEFFIYSERKPNHQNDRIWAYTLDDIADEIRIKPKSKYPTCIGVFICFTAKTMCWVVKEKGESWDGSYFREKILLDVVIPFLRDEENVLNVEATTFLHDKAPCMKAIATQQLLRTNNIDFFDNSQWPGSSPDLNVCENLGAILKNNVDEVLSTKYSDSERLSHSVLLKSIKNELKTMSKNTDLFERLLRSYPSRLAAVRAAKGKATDY